VREARKLKKITEIEVWIVSNFPPPVHGVSAFNQEFCLALKRKNIRLRIFPIGTSGNFSQVETFAFSKVIGDSISLLKLVICRFKSLWAKKSRLPFSISHPHQQE
jgi:hypothetical protein